MNDFISLLVSRLFCTGWKEMFGELMEFGVFVVVFYSLRMSNFSKEPVAKNFLLSFNTLPAVRELPNYKPEG